MEPFTPDPEATIVNVTEIMDEAPPQFKALGTPPEEELNRPPADKEAPIVTLVNKILIMGLREKATELYLDPQETKMTVKIRQGGNLKPLMEPLPKNAIAPVLKRLKSMAGLDVHQTQVPQKARLRKSYSGRPVYFFINTLPGFYGEKVIVRIVESVEKFPEFTDLPTDRQGQKQLQNLVSSSAGLVLISGLAQGGQSLTSTLMTFIGQQVQRGMTVGSVEDPIRQAFDGITQMEVNLEDGLSPSHALNLLSGQGLEVLAVDHISDAETAQTVLQTANQGHLVFAGITAKDCATAIAQMTEWVNADLLADNLQAVVSQRYLRRICPTCRLLHSPDRQEIQSLGLTPAQVQNAQFYRANTLSVDLVEQFQLKGRLCRQCNGAGYQGQVGVYEMLRISPNLRRFISKKAAPAHLRQVGQAEGMKFLVQDALGRVLQGETTLEELIRYFPEAVDTLAANPIPGNLPAGFQERLTTLENRLKDLQQAFNDLKQLCAPPAPPPITAEFDDLNPELLALENLHAAKGDPDPEANLDISGTLIGTEGYIEELPPSPPRKRQLRPEDKEATIVLHEHAQPSSRSDDHDEEEAENTDHEATIVHPFKSIVDPW